MKWAKINTNVGSSEYLNMNRDYRIQFNCLTCGKGRKPANIKIEEYDENCDIVGSLHAKQNKF
jgi:hypothetical protein